MNLTLAAHLEAKQLKTLELNFNWVLNNGGILIHNLIDRMAHGLTSNGLA